MATQLQIRRGTAAQVAAFTGAEGEIVYNSTNDSLHTNDGATAGGFELARADLNNVLDADLNAALTGNTLSALTITTLTATGGTINGTVIGGTTAAAGSFTTGAFSSSTVTINNAAANLRFENGAGARTGYIQSRADAFEVWNDQAVPMVFGTNNTTRLTIASTGAATFSGDVGVGNSSPSADMLGANGGVVIGNGTGAKGLMLFGSATSQQNIAFSDTTAAQQGLIQYDHAGDYMRFFTNSLERLRIDSSGNVGIGTSSPAYPLEVVGAAGDSLTITARSGDATAANNAGGGFRNIGSATATSRSAQMWLDADGANLGGGDYFYMEKKGNSGDLILSQYSNAAMIFRVNADVERMRIDASGTVKISHADTASEGLRVIQTTAARTSGGALGLFYDDQGGTTQPTLMAIQNGTGDILQLFDGGSQVVTVTDGGNLLVGTTGLPTSNGKLSVVGSSRFFESTDAASPVACDKAGAGTTTAQRFMVFTINNQSTGSGQINANGASQAAFGTFSDATLKENIVDLPDQYENIRALRPVEFDYIESEGGGHQIGFIAQEMQEVYPCCVGEREDGKLTVGGWNKTEARLVSALQSAMNKIDALTARIEALEGA